MCRVSVVEAKLFACFPAFLSAAGERSKAILVALAEFHRICGLIGQSGRISGAIALGLLFAAAMLATVPAAAPDYSAPDGAPYTGEEVKVKGFAAVAGDDG